MTNSLIKLNTWIDALIPSRCAVCEMPCRQSLICRVCESTIEIQDNSFVYRGAIKTLIQRAKFARDETAAHQLLQIWQSEITLNIITVDAVTFVPLHWRRRLWRRFDLSSLFARAVARKINRPLIDMLDNTRYDKPLTLELGKQAREKATQGRYRLRAKLNTKQSFLLVDDVITTGATMKAASQRLIEQGHEVITLSIAKPLFKDHQT